MTDQVFFTYNGCDTHGSLLGLTASGDARVLIAPAEQVSAAGKLPAVVVVPLVAAYTSLEKSINAKKQLRDKKGRWIEMGKGIFKFMLNGKMVAGPVIGVDTKNKSVTVEVDGVNEHVNPKLGDFVKTKATLSPGAGKGQSAKAALPEPAAPKKLADASSDLHDEFFDATIDLVAAAKTTKSKDTGFKGLAVLADTVMKSAKTDNFQLNLGELVDVLDTGEIDTDKLTPDEKSALDRYNDAARALDVSFNGADEQPKAKLDAPDAPDTGTKPLEFSSQWKQKSGQKGSNAGGIYTAPDGKDYYVKFSQSSDHARNEVLADNLYELLGIRTSRLQLLDLGNGDYGTASELIEGGKTDLASHLKDKEYLAELGKGFAADAWLANWDVAGLEFDNVMTDKDGKPVRIDPGGALLFRAMGTKKTDAQFSDKVIEWDTLVDPSMNPQSAKVFGGLTEEQKDQSAQKVGAVTDAQIDDAVDGVGFTGQTATLLKARLKARRDDVMQRAGQTPMADWEKELLYGPPQPLNVKSKPLPPATPAVGDGSLESLQKLIKDSGLENELIEVQNTHGMPPKFVTLAGKIEVLADELQGGTGSPVTAVLQLNDLTDDWNTEVSAWGGFDEKQYDAAMDVTAALAEVQPALAAYLDGTNTPITDTDEPGDDLVKKIEAGVPSVVNAAADVLYGAVLPMALMNDVQKLHDAAKSFLKVDAAGKPEAGVKFFDAYKAFVDDFLDMTDLLSENEIELGDNLVDAFDNIGGSLEIYAGSATTGEPLEADKSEAPAASATPPQVADGVIGTFNGKPYVADGDGNAMFEGDTVKSKKDGVVGVIKKIEGNGKYVKVQTPDGAVKGRRTNTLEVQKAAPSTAEVAEPVDQPVQDIPNVTDEGGYYGKDEKNPAELPVGTKITVDPGGPEQGTLTKKSDNVWGLAEEPEAKYTDSDVHQMVQQADSDGLPIYTVEGDGNAAGAGKHPVPDDADFAAAEVGTTLFVDLPDAPATYHKEAHNVWISSTGIEWGDDEIPQLIAKYKSQYGATVTSDSKLTSVAKSTDDLPTAPAVQGDVEISTAVLSAKPDGTKLSFENSTGVYKFTKGADDFWLGDFAPPTNSLKFSSSTLNGLYHGGNVGWSNPQFTEPVTAPAVPTKLADLYDENGHVFPPKGVSTQVMDDNGDIIHVGDVVHGVDDADTGDVVGWTVNGELLVKSVLDGSTKSIHPNLLVIDADNGPQLYTSPAMHNKVPAPPDGTNTWITTLGGDLLKVGDTVELIAAGKVLTGQVLGSAGSENVVVVQTSSGKHHVNGANVTVVSTPTPAAAPEPVVTPSAFAADPSGKKYIKHPFSEKPIYVGTEVKHPTFGVGTVKTLESNGKYVKVTFTEPDGSKKVKGLAISKLDVTGGDGNAPAAPAPPAPPALIEGAVTLDGAQVHVGDVLVKKAWTNGVTPKFNSSMYVVIGPAASNYGNGYAEVKTEWGSTQYIAVGSAIHAFPNTDAPKVPSGHLGAAADGKKYMSTHFGTPVFIGTKVKNTSDMETVYTVTAFESNGKYVKVSYTAPDGKKKTKGMAVSKVVPVEGTVKLDASDYLPKTTPGTSAKASPASIPAATSKPYTGELSLPHNPSKSEAFVGASAAAYNEQGASLPGVSQPGKKTLDESHPLFGTPEPQLPSALKVASQPYVSDEWVEKVKQRYLDNPNKAKPSLEQSNNWGKVENVVKNGDLSALDQLLASKYVDDALYADAKAQIAEVKAAKKKADKDHAKQAAEYGAQHKAWVDANVVTTVNPNGFTGMPELSTKNVDPSAPDWSQAHAGTASLDSVLAKLKTDTDFAGRGIAVAVDGGAIEGVEVYTRHVRKSDGTLALELRMKLSPAHGDALASALADKGVPPAENELSYYNTSIGDDGIVKYSKAKKHSAGGYTYDIDVTEQLGGDLTGTVAFERAGLDKTKINQHVRHNLFTMTLSPDATSADISKVFERFGVEARPATEGDLKVLAENKMMAVMDTETDPLKNPKAGAREATLAAIKEKYGVTADQVIVGYTSQGHLAFYLPDHARDKAIASVGGDNLKGFAHNISGGAEVIAQMITGKRPGMLSTHQRWTSGIGAGGMSSTEDVGSGGADFMFTKPKHHSHHTGSSRMLMVHPKAMMRRLDLYGNSGDGFGKHKGGTHVYGLIADDTTYEIMPKHGVPLEDIWYIQAYSAAERDEAIAIAKSKGTYEVNGIPIEDFIITPGGNVPTVDEYRWNLDPGAPAVAPAAP